MIDKTPPEARIEDASARVPHAAHERVYRSAAGYLVKVATERSPSDDPSRLHFRVVGGVVGDDGAHELVDGIAFVGAPHVLTVQSDSRVDLAAELAAAHALIVRRMETAALHQAQARALAANPNASWFLGGDPS